MQDRSGGFSLIELMIVLAIAGMLAAIAIPLYGNYAARAQVAEGLQMTSGLKTAVAEIHASVGTLAPIDSGSNGLPPAASVTSDLVSEVRVTDGVITVLFDAAETHPDVGGGSLVLTPSLAGGSSSWSCSSPDLPDPVLPSSCR